MFRKIGKVSSLKIKSTHLVVDMENFIKKAEEL